MSDPDDAVDGGNLVAEFTAQRQKIERFVALRCGSDDTQDLMHELWLKVRAVGRPIEYPGPYIFRMADRLILDHRRGSWRSQARENDWVYVHDRLSTSLEMPTAENRLLAEEMLEAIDKALQSVGARARFILRRHRVDGVEQKEIARELGVSISTVEKDLRTTYQVLMAVREKFHGV